MKHKAVIVRSNYEFCSLEKLKNDYLNYKFGLEKLKKELNSSFNYNDLFNNSSVFSLLQTYYENPTNRDTEFIIYNEDDFDLKEKELLKQLKNNTQKYIVWSASNKGANGPLRNCDKNSNLYFYYNNLPYDNEDRLLMKSKLLFNAKKNEKIVFKDIYYSENETQNFEISDVIILSYDACQILTKTISFNDSKGKSILKFNNQSSRIVSEEEIIAILDKPFNNKNAYIGFDDKEFNNFLKCECSLKNIFNNKNFHNTFISRKNVKYLENHHFIPQGLIPNDIYRNLKNHKYNDDDYIALYKIIYDVDNKKDLNRGNNQLFLCSNCHNLLHYGREKEVKQLLKDIINKLNMRQSSIEAYNLYRKIQIKNNSKEKLEDITKLSIENKMEIIINFLWGKYSNKKIINEGKTEVDNK